MKASVSAETLARYEGLAALDSALLLSKHQIFKWCLSRYLVQPGIRLPTEEGKKLREGLKGIWAVNCGHEEFPLYLGQRDQRIITDVLALKAAATSATGLKVAGKQASKRGLEASPAETGKRARKS